MTSQKIRRGPRHRTTAITYRGSAKDCWITMARAWGVGVERSRKRIAEAQQTLADLIAAAHANKREDWIRSVFARLDEARPGPALPAEPWLFAAVAKLDGKEDGTLADVLANPGCREAALRWLADARAEVQAKQEAIHAVSAALEAM